MDTQNFTVDDDLNGVRFDKALANLHPALSRARVQDLISEGHAQINGLPCSSGSEKVERGDRLTLSVPDAAPSAIEPEDIPLNIVFEDEHVVVLNKPAGLVVHPGAGNRSGTLVNALLHHCKGQLSGIGGVERPGIVHRLDKDTSGLMMVAKTDPAHQSLSAQLATRSLSRIYHALAFKIPTPPKGVVDAPIGRHSTQRLRMAIGTRNSKDARTHYNILERYGEAACLLECKLESGRTHQIRVHMAHIKHYLWGDPLYGAQITALRAALKREAYDSADIEDILAFPRQVLHAKAISFEHPASGEIMSFESEMPQDLSNLLKKFKK